jgi:hypothetical protein
MRQPLDEWNIMEAQELSSAACVFHILFSPSQGHSINKAVRNPKSLEGAWDTFEKDPRRWQPPLNKLSRDFRATNRHKVRRIDNEDLAQTGVAFIGFASEAVNEKKVSSRRVSIP